MPSDDIQSTTIQRVDAPRPRGEHPNEWHLFLVMECGRPYAGGARFSLAGIDAVAFGRATERRARREGRTLHVGVPDGMMSGSHARLQRVAGWAIVDLDSKNGTIVDGQRAREAQLTDGALVELGGTLFTIRSLPTPADTPFDAEADPDEAASGMATLLPAYGKKVAALEQVIRATVPVLLLGDSGTGKELLARAVHALSGRTGAFVPVNCGAIPETLVESQLFGHTRGAFSGAVRDEPGLVRASDKGTLFLDEIGDLPRASQAALLRVLQEAEVHSIGTTRPIKVDLRVVSATHRRIDALSESGFRTDLYARLAGYVHHLPTLQERRPDLGVIVAALLRDLAPGRPLTIAPEAGRALYAHDWPLNVRELRHTLTAALVFATEGTIELDHLPAELRAPPAPEEGEILRESLLSLLTAHKGNVSEVARAMGKTRMQIHRWMKRFGVRAEDYRGTG